MTYDIVLRYCGSVGWLGIIINEKGEESYRTGRHHKNRAMALRRCDEWLERMGE